VTDRVPVTVGQQRLATIWGAGAVILVGTVVAQSVGGIYIRIENGIEVDKSGEVWKWLVPLLLPTLSLMIGTVASEARKPATSDSANQFAYRMSAVLSLVYYALIAGQLLLASKSEHLDALTTSSLVLAPVQTLVGLALGAFFVSRAASEASAKEPGKEPAAAPEPLAPVPSSTAH
jgi:hypothetical protein